MKRFNCKKVGLCHLLFFIHLLTIAVQVCNDTNCATCSSTGPYSCQTCSGGFNLANGTCCSTTLSNCASCLSTPTTCDSCTNNSYAIYGTACSTCTSLMTGCSTCTSSSSCSSCVSNQYFLNTSSLCEACSSPMDGCLTCSAQNVCTGCANNSIAVDPSTNQCASCSSLMAGCSTCSSSTACTLCTTNTYLLNGTQCTPCSNYIANCANCSSSTVCTACVNETFTIDPNTSQCALCETFLEYCDNCSSPTVCNSCMNSSFFVNATNQCDFCTSALYGCRRCSASNKCTRCINSSYVLNTTSDQCVDCDAFLANCMFCRNSNTCTTCITSPNIVLSNRACVNCSVPIPNCLNCTRDNVCTVCSKYYALNVKSSSTNCMLCGSAMAGCIDCSSKTVCTYCGSGQIVINGCSSVLGCIAVVQKSPTSICTSCNTTLFQPTPVNGKCVCLDGYLVGQYCTLIVGCTSLIHKNNTDTCTSCNEGLNFVLRNGICYCKQYYELKNKACSDICGDGVVITLPCDDGNLIDGDGCSSTCQKQSGYRCTAIAPNTQSKCIFQGWVKLEFVCVYKSDDNLAKVVLAINPYVSNIQKSNLNIVFNSSKNCSMTYYQIAGSNIQVFIAFSQDIQGSNSSITLPYDSNFILSPTGSISFIMRECNGDKLLYQPNPSKIIKKIILFMVKLFPFIFLIIWFIGSYSHKMIGVQTLHTIHLILISQVFAMRYYPVFSYFNQLSSTLNFFEDKFMETDILSQTSYSRLNYHANFIYNYAVIAILELLSLLVFLVLYIAFQIKEHKKKDKSMLTKKKGQSRNKMLRIKNFIYNFLVFPLFIGFYLNFVISLMISSTYTIPKQPPNSYLQTIGILLILAITYLLFASQWKYLLIKRKDETDNNYKDQYVPIYLTNLFLLSLIILASLAQLISRPLEFLAVSTLIYTIVIIVYKPYEECFHNVCLIINQGGVVLNLGWLLSQHFIYLDKNYEQMLGIGLIIWIVLIAVLAVIRIIIEIQKSYYQPEQGRLQNSPSQANPRYDIYQNQMVSYIKKQTTGSINSYRIQSQLNRQKAEQEQIKNKNRLKQLRNKLRYKAPNQWELEQQQKLGMLQHKQALKKPLSSYQDFK